MLTSLFWAAHHPVHVPLPFNSRDGLVRRDFKLPSVWETLESNHLVPLWNPLVPPWNCLVPPWNSLVPRLELLGGKVKMTSVKCSNFFLSQNSRMLLGVAF